MFGYTARRKGLGLGLYVGGGPALTVSENDRVSDVEGPALATGVASPIIGFERSQPGQPGIKNKLPNFEPSDAKPFYEFSTGLRLGGGGHGGIVTTDTSDTVIRVKDIPRVLVRETIGRAFRAVFEPIAPRSKPECP